MSCINTHSLSPANHLSEDCKSQVSAMATSSAGSRDLLVAVVAADFVILALQPVDAKSCRSPKPSKSDPHCKKATVKNYVIGMTCLTNGLRVPPKFSHDVGVDPRKVTIEILVVVAPGVTVQVYVDRWHCNFPGRTGFVLAINPSRRARRAEVASREFCAWRPET